MYDDNNNNVQPDITKRDNALYIKGVDDMSTKDVHTYISIYTAESKPRIEWIDDSSLNLVYYSAEDAQTALSHLITLPTDTVTDTVYADANSNPEKPDAKLSIRYATSADVKVKGAKDRSRWYLFHPEDDPDINPRRKPYSRPVKPKPDLFADRKPALTGEALFSQRIAEASTRTKDLFADRKAPPAPPLSLKDRIAPDLFAHRVAGGPQRRNRRKAADLF